MLDFGFSEILLTSVIALVVLGPERLPKVAKQVGNWVGRARAMARQLGDQLDREVSAADISKFDLKPETKTAPHTITVEDTVTAASPAADPPAPVMLQIEPSSWGEASKDADPNTKLPRE